MKTWLITGCSSGLGRSLAQAVLEAGYNAVVTARTPEKLADLISAFPQTSVATTLDVTKPDQVVGTVKLAEQRFGGVDVLVNNAGHGYRGAIEEGAQPGDPARAARALIKVVEGKTAPFRILLGSDAVRIVNAELEAQRQEIEDWKKLSVSTDFPTGN